MNEHHRPNLDRPTTIIIPGMPGRYLTRGTRSVACLLAACLAAVPALAQHRLLLSSSSDFSSADHLFVDGETIYMKVRPRTDIDASAIIESSFRFEPVGEGEVYEGTLEIEGDDALSGSVPVSELQGSSTAWLVTVRVRDHFDHGFERRSAIAIRGRGRHAGTFRYFGVIAAASDSEITMGEHTFAVGDETRIHMRGEPDPAPEDLEGRRAAVIALREEDGSATALQVFVDGRDEIKVVGRIENTTASSVTVQGMTFAVNEATVIERWKDEAVDLDSLPIGAWVKIEGRRSGDGWIAEAIRVFDDQPRDDHGDRENEIEGVVEAVSEDALTVGGMTITVTDETEFDGVEGLGQIMVGATVEIKYVIREDGIPVATEIEIEDEDDRRDDDDRDARRVEVEGVITDLTERSITVEGIEFAITNDTKIEGRGDARLSLNDLHTGLEVEVKGVVHGDGPATAHRIKVEDGEHEEAVVIRGVIAAVESDGAIRIGETAFFVTDDTVIRGEKGSELAPGDVEIGMFARVHLAERSDGSLVALRMKVDRPFEDGDVEIVGRIQELSETEITVHGLTFAVTEETEITDKRGREVTIDELRAGQVVKVEGERDDSGRLTAEEISVKSRLHYEGWFAGVVTAIDEQSISIDGVAFAVTDETIVRGASSPVQIAAGRQVKLRYRRLGDGTRTALYIRVYSDEDSETGISGTIDEVDGSTVLVASVPVYTTAGSRIEDENGDSISTSDLDSGWNVSVKGNSFGHGLLAERIRIEEAVVVSGAVTARDSNSIRVVDRQYLLDDETLIVDRQNVQLDAAVLTAGAYVEMVAISGTERGFGAMDGGSTMSADRVIVMENSASTVIDEGELTIPDVFTLKQNHPNPFNPSTTITFEINRENAEVISLSVFDVLGRKVRTLVESALAPGMYSYVWNGRDDAGNPVASGIYLYRLEVDGHSASRSMTLIK